MQSLSIKMTTTTTLKVSPMNHPNSRIPDEMVPEIFKEATQLQAKTNQGMSMAELEQVCSEAGIPPTLVKQAVREVKDRHLRQRVRRERSRAQIKQKAKIILSAGTRILIPTMIVASFFLYRSKVELLFNAVLNQFNSQSQQKQPLSQPTQLESEVIKVQEDLTAVTRAQRDLESEFRDLWLLSNYQPTQQGVKNSEKVLWGKFRDRIAGHTEKEVIRLVGKPDKKSYQGIWSIWYYENVEDEVTGSQGLAIIQFKQEVAIGAYFSIVEHKYSSY